MVLGRGLVGAWGQSWGKASGLDVTGPGRRAGRRGGGGLCLEPVVLCFGTYCTFEKSHFFLVALSCPAPFSRSVVSALPFQESEAGCPPSLRLSLSISCAAHLAPLGPWSQDLWSTLQILINPGRHPPGSGMDKQEINSSTPERVRPEAGQGEERN